MNWLLSGLEFDDPTLASLVDELEFVRHAGLRVWDHAVAASINLDQALLSKKPSGVEVALADGKNALAVADYTLCQGRLLAQKVVGLLGSQAPPGLNSL
jgi:hypothetical protein